MKKRERIKVTSVAIVMLLLVGLMTVAVSAIDLGSSIPAGKTITVYTFPANAVPDAAHSGPNPNNGDPYGAPYAKYEYSKNRGFSFAGSPSKDLFNVTYNGMVNGRATCVIELKANAGKSFHVTYLTAK